METTVTFWKTDPIPPEGIVVQNLSPLGSVERVLSGLLGIPSMRPDFGPLTLYGWWSVRWGRGGGVVLSLRDDVEFGGGVYCLSASDNRTSREEFFRLYVQVYELFGALLLEGRSFVTVRDFRRW